MNPIIADPKVSFEDTSIAFSSKNTYTLRRTYWLFAAMNNPFLVKTGTFFLKLAFQIRFPFVRQIVKKTIFAHFCGGESIEDCEKSVQDLGKYHIGAILDYSVEGEKNELGFEKTTDEIIRVVEKSATDKTAMPFAVFKVTGLASTPLLTKVQSGAALSAEEMKAWERVKQRVDAICARAYELKVKILIDGEETWIQRPIDAMAYEMMEKYNQHEPIVYNTFQMYLRASYQNLCDAMKEAENKNYFLGAKLVRGAYMEKERLMAYKNKYPDPIQISKEASDKDFNKALLFCIQHLDRMGLCCGSHNEESNYYLTELMQQYQIKAQDSRVYFAQLYGMSDHISYNLAHAGYRVAKYVPYGPVQSVMPYLFRRASENTSVAGQSSREFTLVRNEWQRRKRK